MTIEANATTQDEALAVVRAYCGWIIAPTESVTFTVDGTAGTVLPLPTLHLTDLHSLTICELVIDVADHAQVEWSQAGFLRRVQGFGGQLRGVVAEVTHGYDDMPLDVQVVLDRLAARAAEGVDSLVQVGQVRYGVGADGLSPGTTLTSVEQAMLDRYRLPVRP